MMRDGVHHSHDLGTEIADLSRNFTRSSGMWMVERPPIVKKCEELIGLVQSSSDHATSMILKTMEAAVIRTLLSLNALQSIPPTGYISSTDLATATKTQESLLERLLRVVVRTGFLSYQNGAYCHTATSLEYTGPVGEIFSSVYDDGVRPLIKLPEYLSLRGREEAKSAKYSAFTWSEGQEGRSTFEILSMMPDRTARIHTMASSIQHLRPYTGFFDYAKLVSEDRERTIFVDVGGGNGHVIKELLQHFPQILPEQCVLEDRAETLEIARTTGLLPTGVRLIEHDYLTRQPIRNAKAYHLRAVAYNLGDRELLQLLEQIVPVMACDSKLLIAENILSDNHTTAFSTVTDMMMLCIGGKERTESNFRYLLDQAGLKIDGIHRAPGLEFGIVEASLKSSRV